MTDIDLQRKIVKSLNELIENHGLAIPKDSEEEWTDWNVYMQEKPYKTDENDELQEDYIIVFLTDEDTDSDGNWVCEIQFIIGFELFETEHQGHIILATAMNNIWQHFKTHDLDNGEYELLPKAHKRWNEENYPNYYEAALITRWKIKELENLEGIANLL